MKPETAAENIKFKAFASNSTSGLLVLETKTGRMRIQKCVLHKTNSINYYCITTNGGNV